MKAIPVSVVKCNSYNNKEVRRALEESLKNIDFNFKRGMKVLIKPNLLSANEPEKAVTTHPVILEELCKILKGYGAKIYIGESSAMNTNLALEVCGIKKLSKYANIINFEGEEKKLYRLNKKIGSTPLPNILFDVDLVINVAKLKTHGLTQVTLCIKNLYGCIPGKPKEDYHKVLSGVKEFSEFLVQIHDKIKPELNIIDGVLGLEGEGPAASGSPTKSKLIIASKNAGAADIIASKIMGFDPYSIYTNKFSGIKIKDISVVGSGKDARLKFKKPESSTIRLALLFAGFLPKPNIRFNHKKCRQCHLCEKKCPVGAIELRPWPEWDTKKCIRCLCCIEVCPYGAISLEEPWIRRSLEDIGRRFIKY